MNKYIKRLFCISVVLLTCSTMSFAQQVADSDSVKHTDPVEWNVVDEVIWVVGDEPILRSEVEALRNQEDMHWTGNPDCSIPEQIAIQKLFLHQAVIDSIEVTDSDVAQDVEAQLNYWIQMAGSKEKLEEYRKMTTLQMREELRTEFKNREIISQVRKSIASDVHVTPSDVRKYFKDLPSDSIPEIPEQYEVQIITHTPKISPEEINSVKNDLREYTQRITNGETSFAALARMYSEDGSARLGGELDYMGRGELDPAFAAVAFNLTDPKKVSKIVESEFGFHIIQLIDRRGDKIKVRHILRKPIISPEATDSMRTRLDSLASDIRAEKLTFEEAATYVSDDKDTKNSQGNMVYTDLMTRQRTSKFQISQLPSEIAREVSKLSVGEISAPFVMTNAKNRTVVALVKLKNRIPRHKATITEDFQTLSSIVEQKKMEEKLNAWIKDKIKATYVRINPKYRDCDYEYDGWIK
ncbi:MAG: peptidylprolyl isomerase [Prevotella sp.]|nr:peptidylprolyl isomerase [Candidatus Equicola faecalis]